MNEATNSSSSVAIQKTTVKELISYTLHLADNALILGHRNSEWTGHGPILEQDIAISNIALDLIGQSRNFYQYAAELINEHNVQDFFTYPIGERPQEITEDDLAFLRDAREFRNCLLVEQPKGDWAQTILRQFFFSVYQCMLFSQLQQSKDERLAAIAEKSLKETTYHLKWSGDWVIRLGDGTDESHERMLKAIDELWMFTGELFEHAPYEAVAFENGWGADLTRIQPEWLQNVKAVFEEATLSVPSSKPFQTGGKIGLHSEHLGYILAEMQFLQRAYPNSTW